MHKRTFHGLKRTFMHVSGLLPTYFDLKKSNYFTIWLFLNQNTMGEDQRHTETCVLGPETHVYACPRSSPPCFDKNKQMVYQIVFVKTCKEKTSYMHKRTFHGLKRTFMHVSGLLPTYFDLKKSNFFIIWLFLNQNTIRKT